MQDEKDSPGQRFQRFSMSWYKEHNCNSVNHHLGDDACDIHSGDARFVSLNTFHFKVFRNFPQPLRQPRTYIHLPRFSTLNHTTFNKTTRLIQTTGYQCIENLLILVGVTYFLKNKTKTTFSE
jgi:hypothetical protein